MSLDSAALRHRWSEAEAMAEAQTRWPSIPHEEMTQLCDDCDAAFWRWFEGMGGT